jgi:hypothetical protein
VPSRAPLGISGVESGKSAPLVGRPPGVELHPVVDELPSGDAGDMVPVALPIGGPMSPIELVAASHAANMHEDARLEALYSVKK